MANDSGSICITLKRSLIGRSSAHQACVQGLGLRKIGQSRYVTDTPQNRGMIKEVSYLLSIEEKINDTAVE